MFDIQSYGLIEDGLDWVLYVTLISAVVLFVVAPDFLGLSALAPVAGMGLFVFARQ